MSSYILAVIKIMNAKSIITNNYFKIVVIFIIPTLIVLYPLFTVEILPLGDYINHLARVHIVTTIDQSAHFQRYYEVAWRPIPYLVMDALIPPLIKFMPIYEAGRAFVAICILLPVFGATFLHYTIFQRIGIAPLSAFLFSYNYLLSWGFLSYLFSVGICLFLFAGWIASTKWDRWVRALIFSLAALLLYFSHVFGFAAYCVLVGGFEIGRAWCDRPSVRHIALDWIAAASQAMPAVAIWVFADRNNVFEGAVLTAYGGLSEKIIALKSPTLFSGGWIDSILIIAFFVFLLLGLATRVVRIEFKIWLPIVVLSLVAIATPSWLFGVWGVDFRLPLIVVLVLVGGLSLRIGPVASTMFIVALCMFLVAKSVSVSTAFLDAERTIEDTRLAVAIIPRGALVLAVESKGRDAAKRRPGPWRMTSQMANIAVIERDAFVPFLFSELQLVRTKARYQFHSTPNGHPITAQDLREGIQRAGEGNVGIGDGQGRRIYWYDWPNKFEYVLWQHYGMTPKNTFDNLELIFSTNSTNLYKVRN